MPRKISEKHFPDFICNQVGEDGLEPNNQTARSGLRKADEAKLNILRKTLGVGIAELDSCEYVEGEQFFEALINKRT